MSVERSHYEQEALWLGNEVGLDYLPLRLEAFRSLLPDTPTSVLEVGAGDGRTIHAVAELLGPAVPVVAVERSATAAAHLKVPTSLASIDAIPLRARSFDLVICAEVLEHLPTPVFERARQDLARVAARCVLISVPNRENRQRSSVRCADCGCIYNPDRHLRSFTPDDMHDLLPGFCLDELIETGPRQPLYPRRLRWALEMRGLLQRPGSPSCPQCGSAYGGRPAQHRKAPPRAQSGARLTGSGPNARVRRFLPTHRHPYWLVGRYLRDDRAAEPA